MPIGIAYCIAYCIVWLGGGGEGGGWGWGGAGGSWAGPVWFWLGGPRVLGRAGLVLNTLDKLDSDKDVNIILSRNMTVIRMLI